MNFTLTITGENSSELLSVLTQLANKVDVPETVAAPAQLESIIPVVDLKSIPKTTRKTTKTEALAEKTEETKVEITVEALRAAVSAKAQGGKREAVKSLLTSYGAENLTALSSEHYEAFLNQINAL